MKPVTAVLAVLIGQALGAVVGVFVSPVVAHYLRPRRWFWTKWCWVLHLGRD